MPSLVLGIDIGTSATKAVLVDADGKIVATASCAHGFDNPRPGYFEHDAERVWWGDVVHVARELLDGRPGEPAAVAVSGIGPCALITDDAGKPLHKAILYGIDSRASAEIKELNDLFGAEEIAAACGSSLTSQAVGPKLWWLRKQDAGLFVRSHRMLMPSSLAVFRLTGEYVLDHHSASQCDPLYQLAETRWIEGWWNTVAGDLPAPRLVWPGEVAGTVSAAAATETGIPAGTPVCGGTIDAWAESVAAGVTAPGETMIMYGSTIFLIRCLNEPVASPALWATVGVRPDTFSLAAGLATGGLALGWAREMVGEPSWDDFLQGAAAVPAGARGALFLPYLAGERTPIFDPDARGLLIGLTLNHGSGELARAVIEGVALAVRHNIEVMESASSASVRIVGVGGGIRGDLLPQIVTDVTGREQAICPPVVGASYGSAILAAGAVNMGVPGEWTQIERVLEPLASTAPVYDELFAHYCELYDATADHMHALAQLV